MAVRRQRNGSYAPSAGFELPYLAMTTIAPEHTQGTTSYQWGKDVTRHARPCAREHAQCVRRAYPPAPYVRTRRVDNMRVCAVHLCVCVCSSGRGARLSTGSRVRVYGIRAEAAR